MFKRLAEWYRKINSWSVDILGVEAWTIPCFILCWRMKLPPDPEWLNPKRK